MNSLPEWILGIAVGALIALGRELASIRQTKKDVNGLGAKAGKLQEQDIRIIVALLVVTEKRHDRELLAGPFLNR